MVCQLHLRTFSVCVFSSQYEGKGSRLALLLKHDSGDKIVARANIGRMYSKAAHGT
jgi:hypothetical protein